MYPATFLSYFPAFPRNNDVFVAIPFSASFRHRWTNVIEPTINSCRLASGATLRAHRVDTRLVSDSILTEILQGVSQSQLVFADVSTIGVVELDGERRAIRNPNVMYEVGLAHAVRLPEEVLVFRSDSDALPFDTANVRVNAYSPDTDVSGAISSLRAALEAAIRESDLIRHAAVERVCGTLDLQTVALLATIDGGQFQYPEMRTMGQVLGSSATIARLHRLLDQGLVRVETGALTAEMVAIMRSNPEHEPPIARYRSTTFGNAVLGLWARRADVSTFRAALADS